MITQDVLINKLRADYGDDELNYLAEYYPIQLAHIAKVSLYYLKQDEQELQRNQENLPASGLQPETGGEGQPMG